MGAELAPGGGSSSGSGSGAALPDTVAPRLPVTPDGAMELRALDEELAQARHAETKLALLLERAAIRQRLEDYLEARELSAAWVADAPGSLAAWTARARVLSRIHDLTGARDALERVKHAARDPSDWEDLAAAIADLAGEHARAAELRERAARAWPTPVRLTLWAGSLARLGRTDEALAVMPRAAAALRGPPAKLVAWLLFQWALLHEQRGEPAAARRLLEEARRRLPGHVEVAVHLAEALRATGGDATSLATAAAAADPDPYPDLLALAGRLPEARAGWERYVAALPAAFADHAARFYLGAGADPRRALALARTSLAHRPTAEARALAIEAALAAGEPAVACELATPLAEGTRPHQLLAWRAFTACGDREAARRIATHLGIPPEEGRSRL
jgi:tetratricopeptide (TPR) repeat protein